MRANLRAGLPTVPRRQPEVCRSFCVHHYRMSTGRYIYICNFERDTSECVKIMG